MDYADFEASQELPVEVILSEDVENSQSLKTISCPECVKYFNSQSSLKIHVKRVHDKIKDHMCDICSKSFSTNRDLTLHKLVHTGDKNFHCNICGKSYQTKDYLIIHTRIHTGEKPYFCELCGKSFSDPSSFKQHEKQHLDTNINIPCEVCGKNFKREKNLKLHMLVHSENHSTNSSEVDTMGSRMVFSNEFKLDALKKVQEIGQRETSKLLKIPYTTLRNWVNVCKKEHNCQFCGRSFPFKASLERHEKLKHGDISPKINFSKIKYDPSFKKEVAEYAMEHSTEEAMKKYNLADSTIRRWIKVTKAPIICTICGRTCAYKRELERHLVEVHNADNIMATKVEEPLHDFLANSGEHLTFDKKEETIVTTTVGMHDTKHLAFFKEIIKKYSGAQLTQILEKIRSLTESELDSFVENQKHTGEDSYNTLFPSIEISSETTYEEEKLEQEETPKEPIVLKIKKENIEPPNFKKEVIDSSEEEDSDCESDYEESDFEETGETHCFDDEPVKIENEDITIKEEDSQYNVKAEIVDNDCWVDQGENKPSFSKSEFETNVKIESACTIKVLKKALPCEICGKTFKAPCDLKRHIVKHTGEKAFSCQVCGALFAHQHGVDRHMKIHSNERPYVCSHCNKGFNQKTSMLEHERSHTGEKPYKCDECEEWFASKRKIYNHKVTHHNAVKPYTCEECGKGFMRSNELAAHKRTHTGEKPFTCERCGDCFTFIGGLQKHRRRHAIQDGELSIEHKRVDCPQCGKVFYTKANLNRHMKSHLGIKDFQCVDCGKQYSSDRSLQQHVAIVHLGQRGFECEECGKSFTRITSLKVHKLTHTNECPYRCEFCSQGYKEKRNLIKHIERLHPGCSTYNTEQMYNSENSEQDATEKEAANSEEYNAEAPDIQQGEQHSFSGNGISPHFLSS